MSVCRSCSRQIPSDSALCPYCAEAVDTLAATQTPAPAEPRSSRRRQGAEAAHSSSFDSIDDSRFAAGTVLAGRYRVVGLLGRGGMGEVYRADDLKLRQPVALKFLPEALTRDAGRLERFHHEVRIARQVSHPNVCRVYDIAEADDQHFISMEYVHGEDLSAIFKRMGRPSKDKALDIARQICAGLAAAHDKGVLHRDLKPHNVMIDAAGKVRITDFGLAGFAEDFTGAEVRAGTPAYMAPEQLQGREVSVKSDVYALGLVLFELFTGRRAFEEDASGARMASGASVTPTTLSGIAEDIDPDVERVILRCLEHEPVSRPSSALAVAAALPGADPLAAALAAGETPSPTMVADAGGVGGMRPALATMCALGILVAVVLAVALRDALYTYVPLEMPPQVLADRATQILQRLGHEVVARDRAYGFTSNGAFLEYVEDQDRSPERWQRLTTMRPPALLFWYRTSPRRLIPPPSSDRVTTVQPPLEVSGMVRMALDPRGRLQELEIVPPERDDPRDPEALTADFSVLFAEADLDPATFRPAQPLWAPNVYCNHREAWTGQYPNQPEVEVRVEAGSYRGRANYFRIVGPWSKATRMEETAEPPGQRAVGIFFLVLLLSMVAGSILIARRNLKLRRVDRGGAGRFALVFLLATLASWVLVIDHTTDPWEETERLMSMTGLALLVAATLWLLYVALEPYVRRHWPQVLISWSRLLAGRFRDPLIGRDVLIGALFGCSITVLNAASGLADRWMGAPPQRPTFPFEFSLLGGRYLLGHLINPGFVWFGLFLLFMLFVFKLLLRRAWLAGMLLFLIATVPNVLARPELQPLSMVFVALAWAMLVIMLLRFGLLTTLAAFFTSGLLGRNAVTSDLSVWYANNTILPVLVIVALVAYAFHTALAGRPLFRDDLLEQ